MTDLTLARARKLLHYSPSTGRLYRLGKMLSRETGTVSGNGYMTVRVDGRNHIVHRLVWLLFYGKWPKHTIDHVNCVRDDNRIANLRDVPLKVNLQNRAYNKVPLASVQLSQSKRGESEPSPRP